MVTKTHWADPEFRKKMTQNQSEGAKRRWSDPEKRAAVLLARANGKPAIQQRARANAAKFGLTGEEWVALTAEQRRSMLAEFNKKPDKRMVAAAKKHGVSYDEWKSLSTKEKSRLRDKLKKTIA